MSLSAGLLLVAAAQGSPWDDPAPTGRWAGSTQELAAYLLPPEMAADAVGHRVQTFMVPGDIPYLVQFAGHARPSGQGFCERYGYNVYLNNMDKGFADREAPRQNVELRLGSCPIDRDAIFANLNSSDPSEAKMALRWAAWAQRAARSKAPLPFRLSCKTETGPDRCADGGRAALAALPLEKTMVVMPERRAPAHHWSLSVTETQPSQLYWDVKIDATPEKAAVDLIWKIPAPF